MPLRVARYCGRTQTGALFVGSLSHVDLVGAVEADAKQVKFRFTETLAFNLPLIKPKVPLTGTLILTRGEDGLRVDGDRLEAIYLKQDTSVEN